MATAAASGVALGLVGAAVFGFGANQSPDRLAPANPGQERESSEKSRPVSEPDEAGLGAAQAHVERMLACMKAKGYKVTRLEGGAHELAGPPGPIETMLADQDACRADLGVKKGKQGSRSQVEEQREADGASPAPS